MNATSQQKSSITAQGLNQLLLSRKVELLDVRTPGEFASAHLPGARSVPLDTLDTAAFVRERGPSSEPVYLVCQSGTRARKAMERLQGAGFNECVLVEGGTQAWMDAGFPVERSGGRVLPLMQQVQIAVGLISVVGALMALLVTPWFALLPLLIGGGLIVAGITGYCRLAMLLAKMPWNRVANGSSHSCCTARG